MYFQKSLYQTIVIIFVVSLLGCDNTNQSKDRQNSIQKMMIGKIEKGEVQTCPQCGNTGRRVCYGCGGTGYNRYDNRLECIVCGGQGTVACPALTCPLKTIK